MRVDGGSAGRRGDFITSPEVGPLFGVVVARYLDSEWERIGRPDRFTVVDVGAGPGTLARAVAAAAPACREAMRYVAVEVSAAQRARHPDGIESRADLPPRPVRRCGPGQRVARQPPVPARGVRRGVARGARRSRSSRRPVRRGPVPTARPDPGRPSGEGHPRRACADHRSRRRIRRRARGRSSRSGSVLVVDYGVPRTGELAMRPWREWLRTYRSNERGDHYLADPGGQDITIDVPFDQLPEPDAVRSQAQFLQRWGIDDLVAEGVRVWTEQAARPGLEAMRMRSRVQRVRGVARPGRASAASRSPSGAPDPPSDVVVVRH